MPRAHLASSLLLGSLLAVANTQCPAFGQESTPPGGKSTTLPPVKVTPLPTKPAKAPRAAIKKKAVPQTANRGQPASQAAEQGDTGAGGAASGSGVALVLPGRDELSPAALGAACGEHHARCKADRADPG